MKLQDVSGAQLKKIVSDEAFIKSLLELEEPSQVQAAFKEKGIELSEQEVIEMRDAIVKALESGEFMEELSLDQLDDVSGGFLGILTLGGIVAFILGTTFGGAILVGGAIGVAYALSERRW